jgi:phage gp45-like
MIDAIRSQISKAKTQVRQCFLGIVARGSSSSLQLKGFADEVLQEVELVQQVGFSSHVPDAAKVVVIPLQGKLPSRLWSPPVAVRSRLMLLKVKPVFMTSLGTPSG